MQITPWRYQKKIKFTYSASFFFYKCASKGNLLSITVHGWSILGINQNIKLEKHVSHTCPFIFFFFFWHMFSNLSPYSSNPRAGKWTILQYYDRSFFSPPFSIMIIWFFTIFEFPDASITFISSNKILFFFKLSK